MVKPENFKLSFRLVDEENKNNLGTYNVKLSDKDISDILVRPNVYGDMKHAIKQAEDFYRRKSDSIRNRLARKQVNYAMNNEAA